MADLYLHSRLSEEVLKKLDYDFDMGLVFLGSQGPDPLYYNVSKKDGKDYRYHADRMHDTNTQMLFKNMVMHVKSNTTKETYSHMIGFICHYALDVKIHPYVYYNAGVYKKDDPSTHKYRGLHLKFERSIDAVKILEEQKMKPNKFKIHKTYFTVQDVPIDVMNVMGHVLKQTYGKDHGGLMYKIGTKKMYGNIKNIVHDRWGLKNLLLKFIDLFSKGDMFYEDISFANHIEEYDYLNNKKATWHHPVTNEEHNESVDELFEQARVFALDMIKNVNSYIFDDKNIDLDKVFTNLSFNSGLNCDLHEKMTHFKMYRK